MSEKKMILRQRQSEPGAAYLELLEHPHGSTDLMVSRSVDVHALIEDYDGPRICIDLNAKGQPVGIEILYAEEDDSDD